MISEMFSIQNSISNFVVALKEFSLSLSLSLSFKQNETGLVYQQNVRTSSASSSLTKANIQTKRLCAFLKGKCFERKLLLCAGFLREREREVLFLCETLNHSFWSKTVKSNSSMNHLIKREKCSNFALASLF